MSIMELSIIVVHFRKPAMLKLCLDSIHKSLTAMPTIDYELIVVDSMTQPEHKRLVRERYPNIIFLDFKENLGYSRAVNLGLKQATGDYLLILNYDVVVSDTAITNMLSYMQKHPDIGMLGPQLRNFNNSHQPSYFRFYTPRAIIARRTPLGKLDYFKAMANDFLMTETDPQTVQTPDWVMGSAMMISRKAYEQVGGMDERFFMYFEDVDWCRRIWQAGFKVVYQPRAIMYHYLGRGSKSRLGIFDVFFNKRTHWHIASAIKYFLKYCR